MPLYDLSYQRFPGPRTSRLRRSLALSRSVTSLLAKRRSFLLLLALCWVPAVVRAVQIYVVRQFPQVPDFLNVTAGMWQDFLSQQVRFLPVVLVALYTGAGAIAADVASGAVAIALSKPLSRLDYVLGKSIPVAGAILAVTLLPALALLSLYLALASGLGLVAESPWLPLSIVGYSLWLALYFTLTVLAVSSLCRSGRVAGAGFAALAFGGIVVRASLPSTAASSLARWLSLTSAAEDSASCFFGSTATGDAPFGSLVAMALVMVASTLVLDRRLRSTEVVQ